MRISDPSPRGRPRDLGVHGKLPSRPPPVRRARLEEVELQAIEPAEASYDA
jgi:hypothetical protein